MTDDDRRDAVPEHDRKQGGEIAIELAAIQAAERLRGQAERVGQREPDADGAQVEPQRAPALVGQFGFRTSFAGCGCASFSSVPGFGGASAAIRSAICRSEG